MEYILLKNNRTKNPNWKIRYNAYAINQKQS